MDTKELLLAAERLKQGLLAKATDGDYADKDYSADLGILRSDKRIEKMMPAMIRVNRNTADFRRAMQVQSPHYAGRRQYISDQLTPIFEYIDSLESGRDSFTEVLTESDLGEQLGRGGFGTVYKYHHKLLDMDFAIKLFEPVFVSNEENLAGEKRFLREAKILFSLNHESIVRIYDIGRFQGQPYIRMEFVNGETMQEFVSKNGPVSFVRSRKPIGALLRGLEYAHRLGVIHRDLKPSNFMVTSAGEFRIIDFGVSAYLETDKHTKLTKTGEVLAGGAYTDPKLMDNPKLRDARSDIYSVGAIWYYLLVGSAPMGGDLKKNLLESGNVSELEASVVMKCLSTRLEERYQSCSEILNILFPTPATGATEEPINGRHRITEITRQGIFDYIVDKHHEDLNAYVLGDTPLYQEPERVFNYFGRRTEIHFLEKLYNLDLPDDPWLGTLRDELVEHTVKANDYPYGWVFDDIRFGLRDGDDEIFLRFLAYMFHPLIRSEKSEWREVLSEINSLLAVDGYEIYSGETISGKEVYSYKHRPLSGK